MPPPNFQALLTARRYPGLTLDESALARAWIVQHGRLYDLIEFNFRLGEGAAPPPELNESTARLVGLLTQKRADLIAQNADQVVIVEVKDRIGASAVGQLEVYRDLWLARGGDQRLVRTVAVGRRLAPDLEFTFQRHRVEVELYPDVPVSPTLS